LYGCGDIALLETGGLAVVGSRHVDPVLIDYTVGIGQLAARAGRTVVSGGARGIDQAAMRGALEAGGYASGVLGDSLEKTAMNRDHRNMLLNGQLVLVSPYDPGAGFHVGHAMQRNKLIYALADTALVVSSDLNKGGTWAGAVEQLDKLRLVPVHVRSTGDASAGLDALRSRGAVDWPDPQNADALEAVFDAAVLGSAPAPAAAPVLVASAAPDSLDAPAGNGQCHVATPELSPADALFAAVRDLMPRLLATPMKDPEVATALGVSNPQAKAWLQRLMEEGVIEKQTKPVGYVVKQNRLFE
jgi:DNA processing protein